MRTYEIVGHRSSNEGSQVDLWEQWLRERPLGPLALEEVISRVEKYFVQWALETAKHNRTRAAELLGLTKVDQLRYLMRKYGIE